MKGTLAIFSPNNAAYSETFIRAHRQLPFNIRFYYSGYLPSALEGDNQFADFDWIPRIKKRFNRKFSLAEHRLIQSLQREKVDCILAEYGPTACESLNVARYLGIPMVVHFHGYDVGVNQVIGEYSERYKQLFQYAHAVVAVSNKMKYDLLDMGCPEEKMVVTACGPSPEFFDCNPSYAGNNFLSIGRFIPKKAPHLIIAAFKQVVKKFPESKLWMVGDGALMPVCKSLVKAFGLKGNVEFKGVLTATEMKTIMNQSLALVQHSVVADDGDTEGTPVAIMEAQAAALPVIATLHAGIPDVVINGETGLLSEEFDIETMAGYMVQLLEDKKLAAQLGSAGRERIANKFSLARHLGILTEAIEKAACTVID